MSRRSHYRRLLAKTLSVTVRLFLVLFLFCLPLLASCSHDSGFNPDTTTTNDDDSDDSSGDVDPSQGSSAVGALFQFAPVDMPAVDVDFNLA
jgi:hypothetical protein